MCDPVKEIEQGKRPIINSGAIKIFDEKKGDVYVYGGIRWPGNGNANSPTCRTTSDLFYFDSYPVPRWIDYTISMRKDESFISPFEETLSHPDDFPRELFPVGGLPALQDPIGAIVHDETAAKTSYLLILGDPVGRRYETCTHPLLVCVNLRLNTWRIIKLRNIENMPNGRARASMIVTGEMRSKSSDLFLCVFGGVREDFEDRDSFTYLDTFAVANLTKGAWMTPNGGIPKAIGPLGIHPGLAKYRDEASGGESILILRGVIGRELYGKNKASRAKANFSKAFLFNPRVRDNQFSEIENDNCVPSPSRTFMIQPSEGGSEVCNEFILVTCGKQRRLNKFPRWPAPTTSANLYIRPEIILWRGQIRATSNDQSMSMETDIRSTSDEESSAEDDSSSTSSDSFTAYGNQILDRSRVVMQKEIRSGSVALQKSGKALFWTNLTGGRVKKLLENLSESFRVEVMFMSGDLSGQFNYSWNHPYSPRLFLLGCDHAYLGEVRVDVFNAFAGISLHSLLEGDDDDSETNIESLSLLDDVMTSARATPEYATSDDEIKSSDTDNLEHPLDDEYFDPALARHLEGEDPFLLIPDSDDAVLATADFGGVDSLAQIP